MQNKNKTKLFSEADNEDKDTSTDKPEKKPTDKPEDNTPPPEETDTESTPPDKGGTDLHTDVDDSNPDVHSDNLDSMFNDIFSGNNDNTDEPSDGENEGGGDQPPDDTNLDGSIDGDNQELGNDDSVYLGDDENKEMEDVAEDEESVMVIVKERFIKLYDKYDKKSNMLDKTDFNNDTEVKINPIIAEYIRLTEQLYNYITNILPKDGIAVQIKTFTEFKFLLETLDNQVVYVLIDDGDEQL